MVYANTSPYALAAMETARTGNYGMDYDYGGDEAEDDTDYTECPYCGEKSNVFYYNNLNFLLGCGECTKIKTTWEGLSYE